MRLQGLRDDATERSQDTIRIPASFFDYNWPHLIPPTVNALYKMVCRLAELDIRGSEATNQLKNHPYVPWQPGDLEEECSQLQLYRLCQERGWAIPNSAETSLQLLFELGLIQSWEEDGEICYDIILPVPDPAQALERTDLLKPKYIKLPLSAVF